MARTKRSELLGKTEKRIVGGGRVVWDDNPFLAVINKNMAPKLRKSANIVANIARDNVPISDPGRERKRYARRKGKSDKKKRTGKYKKSWQERKPGSLLKSIKVVKSKYKDGGYLVKVGGRDTYYWFFVEYGTSKMYPTWFMAKALRTAKSRLRGLF